MKKLYLGLAAMLLPSALTAGTAAANDVLSVALDFYNSLPVQSSQGSVTKIPKAQITATDLVRVNLPAGNLEVFNVKGNRGFVLVNPEGEGCPIIGYSDKGSFDASNLPPQLKKALEQPVTIKANYARSNAPSPVVLYQTAEWGQNAPFNDLCPTVDGQKAPAGCVATAMAITMKYHNWPDCTRGGEETDFYFPEEKFDFDNYTINWDALDNNDDPGFATQAAQLTYSAGVAAQMIYGAWESGAEVWTVSHQLQYFYAYDKECQHLPRDKFDDTQWDAMLRAQLDEVGPVIYHGFGSGGHCFVVDGYNSDGMYHVNWGWDGGSNGYFSLDFSLEGGMSFGEAQGMIINIKPDHQKKQYSRAWIPNAEAYIGGDFGTNGWNFSRPDIVPEETIDFKIPSMCISNFRGYMRVAIADQYDNIVGLTDCWTHLNGYRYFCPFPGADPLMSDVTLPSLNEGQRYQLVTQEVPNEMKGPECLETGYYPAYPPTDNPEDWDLVLGGIVYSSYFYQTGNHSELSEVRFHIDKSMPAFCVNDNTFEHEFTIYRLKGCDCPQNILLPQKGVTVEVKAYDKDGNPGEAIYVKEDEYTNNYMSMNISMYDDQFDVYVNYEFDGDTRKDSELSDGQIMEQDGLVYKIEDDGLTLIGYDKVGESVTIPNSIIVEGNEFAVRNITNEALMFAPIKDLKIECEELAIGALSFAGMENLESVSFGNVNIWATSFEAVPFVKSGLKTVYLNDAADNSGILNIVTGYHNISNKEAVAVKDINFVLTALPQSDPNDCFTTLYYFNCTDDFRPNAYGSYVIPGLGNSDLSQFAVDKKFKIKQMWTYEIDESYGLVRIGNVMDNVEIESVLINGIKVTADADGIYSIDALSPEGGMAVTVNYTISGLKNTAFYSADLNNNIIDTDLLTPVETIILSTESWSGIDGDSFKIDAAVYPENATNKNISWISSDESIAVVDENGIVSVVGVGKAIITAACGEVKSECAVKCYPRLGDANWNGEITITDAVDISNYVVKKKNVPDGWEEGEWTEFYVAGANANESEDGMVTIADASATVELALSQPVAASPQSRMGAARINSNVSVDALVSGAIKETGDGRIAISFNLDNTMEYVALQADIAIPEGIAFEVNPGSRAAGHTLQAVRVDDSHIRIALFSLGNKAFAESNEALFEIVADCGISDLEGMTIFNILASDADANEFVLDYAPEVMSGIDRNVMTDIAITKVSGAIRVSNAVGHRIEVCTVDGRIVKSFIANDALEIIKLPAGLYIVKAADKTLKVVL